MKEDKKKDLGMIDLDETGAIEQLPKEVTLDTLLLTDVSEEISLNMEDTQLLPTLEKYAAMESAKEQTALSEDLIAEETRVIDGKAVAQKLEEGKKPEVRAAEGKVPQDTLVIHNFDETAELQLILPEESAGTGVLESADPDYNDTEMDFETEPIEELDEQEEPDELEGLEEPEDVSAEEDIDEAGFADEEALEEEYPDGEVSEGEGLTEEDLLKEDFPEEDSLQEEERAFETSEMVRLDIPSEEDENARTQREEKKQRMIFTAAIVAACLFLLMGIVLVAMNIKAPTPVNNSLYEVGQRLSSIGVAGESGLIAMAEAQNQSAVTETREPEEGTESTPVEEDTTEQIPVNVTFTSVAKDMKVKFINSETERLVRDVEFVIELTDGNGNKQRYKDEDTDGIIYEKEMTGGTYKMAIVDVKGINFLAVPTSVNVRDQIAYQKVDVKEEIKTEAEVNVSAEDTGGSKPAEEAAPTATPTPKSTDTVEWVESSKTQKEGSGGYTKISKDDLETPSYAQADIAVPVGGATRVCAASTAVATKQLYASEDATPTSIPLVTPEEETTPTPTEKEKADETPTPTEAGKADETPTPTAGDAKNDTTTKLKDKNGNQVYYKDGDKYVEAVYADYYTQSEFYIASEIEYIYTGWQTFDGKKYYFDKNGNKVTGDQIIQGVAYHFDENGVLDGTGDAAPTATPTPVPQGGKILGIDVSKWNGAIDWNGVKSSGVSFVIIRCGYRGSATGVLVEDPTFRSNIQGAKAAGLKVGVYFFSQAVNEVEAVEEASMCLSLVQAYGVEYPIFIDTEFTVNKNGRADGLNCAARTAVCRAFCETIRNGGCTGGVYSSKSWFGPMVDTSALSGFKIWLAHYTSQTDYAGHYDIWQYSSKGSITGISGNVDMNYSYMGY